MIFALVAAILAVACMRVAVPSLLPPAIVREAGGGWEVPCA